MRGFTLVEMIVVIAIIGILAAIVLTAHTNFNRTLLLESAAYDIALSIQSAQSYGIGSRSTGAGASAGGAPYGVEFTAADPFSFRLFADTSPNPVCSEPSCKPGDGQYSASDATVQKYALNNGITVSRFCGIKGANYYCTTGGTTNATKLDIVFARPNTSATTSAYTGIGATGWAYSLEKACITVASPEGSTRSVLVTMVGQVTSTSTCP